MPKKTNAPLSFEVALKELENLVTKMEKGDLNLEQALTDFEQGVGLVRHCQQALAKAEQHVTKLMIDDTGSDDSHSTPSFSAWLAERQQTIEALLKVQLGSKRRASPLWQAMQHACLGAGKRLRPLLVYASGLALDIPSQQLDNLALALELIHGYSLIHDDLPIMDNADMRRGKPSCHRQFDEATALLAGDALLTLAFERLSLPSPYLEGVSHLTLIRSISLAAGPRGMVQGQSTEYHTPGTLTFRQLKAIHLRKTGALMIGAVLGPTYFVKTPPTTLRSLKHFAQHIGLAFQIQDDILDAKEEPHKPSFVTCLGLQVSKDYVQHFYQRALEHLQPLGPSANRLHDLAKMMVTPSGQ